MIKVLCIAGSDCSGASGIQADLKTFAAHGVYGLSVVSAVVAENTSRIFHIHQVSTESIARQIDAVYEDTATDAVKIGMLGCSDAVKIVSGKLLHYIPGNVVIDPIICSSDGTALMGPDSLQYYIKTIVPLADILTPNIFEAEILSGITIRSSKDIAEAARIIYRQGAKNVLIKGGHLTHDACDTLYTGDNFFYYNAPRIHNKNVRGTGCTCSSAIAANLALGFELRESVHKAKQYITAAIKHALPVGSGGFPANHFYEYIKEKKS